MLNIIENYKKLFTSLIITSFAGPENPTGIDAQADFIDESDPLEELKTLKAALSDGKIDLEEAKEIAQGIESIETEAKV